MRVPIRPRLTVQQRRDLAQLTDHLHQLQDIEAQAVIGQGITRDHIEAILDQAADPTSPTSWP